MEIQVVSPDIISVEDYYKLLDNVFVSEDGTTLVIVGERDAVKLLIN